MRKIIITLISFIFFVSPILAGTIYYVDATEGNDSNNGSSPAYAWKTINRVNNSWALINPGDQILLKRGEEFIGTRLSIEKGGSELNPLVIGAYGEGENPIISNSPGGIGCWEDNLSYINIQDLIIKNITEAQAISIRAEGLSHITISRCDIDKVDYNGILIEKVDTYLIEDCNISNCINSGIVILGSLTHQAANGIIRNNTIYNITDNDGITLHQNAQGDDIGPNHNIINNLAYNCREQGVDITSGTHVTARNNETFNNGDSGILIGHYVDNIWIDKHYSHDELKDGIIIEKSSNVKVTSSIIYNATRHSITMGDSMGNGEPCTNFELYNNTITHTNTAPIIDIYSGTQNVYFKNNIIISSLYDNPGCFVRYLAGKTPQNTNSNFNNNIWWRPDGNSTLWYDSEQGKYDFSTWQSYYNQGQGSFFTDPLLESDYHLQPYSSGIDTGTDVGLTSDFEGNLVPQGYGPDIGAYEYTAVSPLQADLNGSPSSGYAPLSVTFTGSASGGTSPYTYSWDFGDGSTSSDQNPAYTFSAAGDYPVILSVTDNNNEQDTAYLNISVSQQVVAMQATANASPASGTVPFLVNFTADATGGVSPYTYSWDFGDGSSSSEQNPTHTYTSAGDYTALLTVTDSLANEASASVNIRAAENIPPLEISANATPSSGIAPLAVSFTGNASGGVEPYTYSWDFGDGSSSTLQNPSHTYSQSGNFTAKLTVIDNQDTEESESTTISVTAETAETQLSISAVTDLPAPGWGGTTEPQTGNHSFTIAESANISANPNKDYRFAKWTGDISSNQAYEENISLTMEQNKNIQAHFYTRCGDVNGDLKITPTDAQRVFELFLGLIPNATEAQLENADVNTDGTPSAPKVTPSDAQAIFEKFLGINELPGDCSCKSRAATSQKETFEQINSFPGQEAVIKINDIKLIPGEKVVVPVIISGAYSLKAFGFDLSYPPEILEFICTESAPFSSDLVQIHANQIADGVIRAGGYSIKPVSVNSEKTLINLVFKVRKNSGSPSSLQIINKFDDFQNLTFKGGRLIFSEKKKTKKVKYFQVKRSE